MLNWVFLERSVYKGLEHRPHRLEQLILLLLAQVEAVHIGTIFFYIKTLHNFFFTGLLTDQSYTSIF
ncbi:hypothetical protein EV688_10614 [Chromatocurvus halotolerans]|uniref:Uncharacterized protein n=1 Tax=Chromatocurvus halotolerans TaxID=1132028 RepID=A0A4R2L9B3_9GAMM|nr:hypothetical protein EV688_10614 [Chromatocurvus halotolerans]